MSSFAHIRRGWFFSLTTARVAWWKTARVSTENGNNFARGISVAKGTPDKPLPVSTLRPDECPKASTGRVRNPGGKTNNQTITTPKTHRMKLTRHFTALAAATALSWAALAQDGTSAVPTRLRRVAICAHSVRVVLFAHDGAGGVVKNGACFQ